MAAYTKGSNRSNDFIIAIGSLDDQFILEDEHKVTR
jgi:hypothetical protein